MTGASRGSLILVVQNFTGNGVVNADFIVQRQRRSRADLFASTSTKLGQITFQIATIITAAATTSQVATASTGVGVETASSFGSTIMTRMCHALIARASIPNQQIASRGHLALWLG